jgi:hypothetical protein
MVTRDAVVHVDIAAINAARRNVREEILCIETPRASP